MWNKPHLLNAIADLLILAGAAALLAGAAVWLVHVPSWPVRQVVFTEPLAHTRRQDIEQVLPAALRGNFFSLNLGGVRQTLETLPWVRRVEVRRVWPSRLDVTVEEHQPVARWGEEADGLVDRQGDVFAAMLPAAERKQLPALAGPPGTSGEVLAYFDQFAVQFAKVGEKPVQLVLSPRLAWQLRLDSGMLIDMGRDQPRSPVDRRLQRFIEVYPETIAKLATRPAVVDLRYPNGFAMRVAGEGKGK